MKKRIVVYLLGVAMCMSTMVGCSEMIGETASAGVESTVDSSEDESAVVVTEEIVEATVAEEVEGTEEAETDLEKTVQDETESAESEELSVDAAFEYFEGEWPITTAGGGYCSVLKLEDSDFFPEDFEEGTKWIFTYPHGGVITEASVSEYTKDSITFEQGGTYYQIIENADGNIEVYYGELADNMQLLLAADRSSN